MAKVSVIVPVYNVYDYLDKCLNSLVNQTLQDIEIIVVNDGATDDSQSIIDKYTNEYSNVKCYIKENGGLSDARNYGMPYATGEYIGFIDSDDYVDLDMYEILYNKAVEDDSDIVECNLHHTYSDYEDDEIGVKIYDKKEMIMNGRSVVWNKIYKRDWLMETGVIFPKGLIYEDVNFFVKLVPYIRKYSYVDAISVHYVQRESSINNMSSKKTLQILDILEDIFKYYEQKGIYEEYYDALEYLTTRIILCSSFMRMSKIVDNKTRKEALDLNYKLLTERFPDWKKNKFLKKNKGKRVLYMKTVNGFTYKIYAVIFALYAQNKSSKKVK